MNLIPALASLALAPLAGGLAAGLDRRLTARMQSRMGPPLVQPFLDVAKLAGKSASQVTPWTAFCATACLVSSAAAVAMLFGNCDLLAVFFVQAAGAVFLVLGALSAGSPFSQVGAMRELMQMMAYEPLIILTACALGQEAGGFTPAAVLAHPEPLLLKLPLVYAALGLALTVKLRKSPFDISACHHGHQEIVRGVYTDYAGPALAAVEAAHWFDTVLVLGLCAMFWGVSWWGMILLAGATYAAEILCDNVCARLTRGRMLALVLCGGLALAGVNLLWLEMAR